MLHSVAHAIFPRFSVKFRDRIIDDHQKLEAYIQMRKKEYSTEFRQRLSDVKTVIASAKAKNTTNARLALIQKYGTQLSHLVFLKKNGTLRNVSEMEVAFAALMSDRANPPAI